MSGPMQTAARVGETSIKYAMAISQMIWKIWTSILFSDQRKNWVSIFCINLYGLLSRKMIGIDL